MGSIIINSNSIGAHFSGQYKINSDSIREFLQGLDAWEQIGSILIYSREGSMIWRDLFNSELKEFNSLVELELIINYKGKKGFDILRQTDVEISYKVGESFEKSFSLITGDYYLLSILLKKAFTEPHIPFHIVFPETKPYSVHVPEKEKYSHINNLKFHRLEDFVE